MPFLGLRIAETIFTEFLLSAICSALFFFGVIDQTIGFFIIASGVCILLNLFFMSIYIKNHLLEIKYKPVCVLTNVTVIAVMAAISLVFAAFNIEPLFTWLFFPYKILNIVLGVSKAVSSLAVSAILLLFSVFTTLVSKSFESEEELEALMNEEAMGEEDV